MTLQTDIQSSAPSAVSVQGFDTPALVELEAQVRSERELIGHRHDWVPEPTDGSYNVLIIGGGQAGLGAAFALQRNRIGRVKVLEAGPEHEVGCWARYARMHTLRSPKHLKGIELDIPSLHIRNWVEARYGEGAWDDIDLVPRLDWNEYLVWYRQVTDADVSFNTEVKEVLPPLDGGNFTVRAAVTDPDGTVRTTTLSARRVVFSLGLDGGGGPVVPEIVRSLPEDMWAHTEDSIDFSALDGKRVAILGGGASGFDNAATALENGAASVGVHMRRDEVPSNNTLRWMEFPGMQEHFFDLSDEQKWEFSQFNGGLPQPPTQASIARAFGYEGFHLYMNSGWTDVELTQGENGPELHITDVQGRTFTADYVISATGYVVDLSLRPELKHFLSDIALWSDRFAGAGDHPLGKCPYLGDGFQFQPREDSPDYISRLFHFSTGARASHGVAGNQLSGIFAGLNRMAKRITTDITTENWPRFMEDFRNFKFQEITSVGPASEDGPAFPTTPRYA